MDTNSKKYKTILADPPWDINQRGKKNPRSAESHYELMPLDRIKAMPVEDLCCDNSALFLWVPNSLLQAGLDTIRAWGFTYRSMVVWCKPRLMMGNYIRTSHETLLHATRGKAPVKFHGQPSWIFAPQQEHSHKPEEQFALIERLYDGPYLELFARRKRPGWDSWGNEVLSDLEIPGYSVPRYSDKVLRQNGKDVQ